MIRIKNNSGYKLLFPDGRYIEKDKEADFRSIDEVPDIEDVIMIGCREDVYLYYHNYYRDSFGDVVTEINVNKYLI